MLLYLDVVLWKQVYQCSSVSVCNHLWMGCTNFSLLVFSSLWMAPAKILLFSTTTHALQFVNGFGMTNLIFGIIKNLIEKFVFRDDWNVSRSRARTWFWKMFTFWLKNLNALRAPHSLAGKCWLKMFDWQLKGSSLELELDLELDEKCLCFVKWRMKMFNT